MANITIGQYYPENSIIHKLDPRVKLAGTMICIIVLFQINTIAGYGLFTIFMAAVIKASKIPFIKYFYDKRRNSVGNRISYRNKRGTYKGTIYFRETYIPYYMYLHNDSYNDS